MRTFLLSLTIFLSATAAVPQASTVGDQTLGLCLGTGARYSTLQTDPLGYLDVEGALVLDGS